MKLARASVKISDTTPFLVHPSILPTPFLWEKFEPPFLRKFQKLKSPPTTMLGVAVVVGFPSLLFHKISCK